VFIDADECTIRTAYVAELGGQYDFSRRVFKTFPSRRSLAPVPYTSGCRENLMPMSSAAVEHAEIGGFIGRPVEVPTCHAAETDGGDFKALRAEFATRNDHAHDSSQQVSGESAS